MRSELGYFASGDSLPGFNKLKKEDAEEVKKLLPAIKAEDIPNKKLKAEPKDEVDSLKDAADEKKIAKQQKSLFQIRDGLKSNLAKADLVALLTKNKQQPPSSLENVCKILNSKYNP